MADRFVLLEVLVLWNDGGVEKVSSRSKTIVNTSAIRSVDTYHLDHEPRRASEGPHTDLWALSVELSDGSSFLARAVDPYGVNLPERHGHDHGDVLGFALRYLNGDRRPR